MFYIREKEQINNIIVSVCDMPLSFQSPSNFLSVLTSGGETGGKMKVI